MNTSRLTPLRSRRALVALLATSVVPFVGAQSIWDGGGANNNWSTPENWNNDTAPVSGNSTVVQLAGNTRTNINIDTPFTLHQLTVNSGAGAFTLTGSEITLNGTSHDTGVTFRNASSNLLTVNNDIKFTAGSGILANAGNIEFNGNINFNGTANIRFLTSNSSRSITINGVISGSSSSFAYNGFGSSGPGTFYVNGANTYTATTNIWHGRVIAGNGSAFGTGAIFMGGPASNASTFNAEILTSQAVTIANNIRLGSKVAGVGINTQKIGGLHTSGTSVFSGNITMGTDAAGGTSYAGQLLTVTSVAGGRVNFTGNLLRAAGASGTTDALTKIGDGIVALAGSNNTYLGATTVEEGTLLINGTLVSGGGAVTVNSGATLGGTGTIGRDVSLLTGSTLQIGDNDAGVNGVLSIGGDLSLANGVTVSLDLGATQAASDSLSVAGAVTLGGTVTFDLSSVGALGDSGYTLLSSTGGIIGSLGNIQVTGYDFSGAYNLVLDDHSLSLVAIAIPEPSSVALLLGGGVLVWCAGARRPRSSR